MNGCTSQNKVLVMYAGKILEYASVEELFYQPQHPYTSGLLKSLPRLDAPQGTELNTIPGSCLLYTSRCV